MPRENVDVVQGALEALFREDMERAVADLALDAEILDYDLPDASVSRGREGFFEWLRGWSESWESWRVDDIKVMAADQHRAIALFRMTVVGRESGVEVARRDAVAYTLRDGKIVRMEYYNDQQQALEAVGLRE